MSDQPTMLKLAEVAAELRLSYKTVRGLVGENRHTSQRLRAVKIGRTYRVRRDWLTEFLNR